MDQVLMDKRTLLSTRVSNVGVKIVLMINVHTNRYNVVLFDQRSAQRSRHIVLSPVSLVPSSRQGKDFQPVKVTKPPEQPDHFSSQLPSRRGWEVMSPARVNNVLIPTHPWFYTKASKHENSLIMSSPLVHRELHPCWRKST